MHKPKALKHLVGRGDLLRCLVHLEETAIYNNQDKEQLDASIPASILDYQYQQAQLEPSYRNVKTTQINQASRFKKARVLQTKKQELGETYYYLEKYKTQTKDELEADQQEIPACIREASPIKPQELRNWSKSKQRDPEFPITNSRHIQQFLDKSLINTQHWQLDLPKLIQQVSELKPLARLPKSHKKSMSGRLCVILDLNPNIKSLWLDCRELVKLIQHTHGKIGLDIRELTGTHPESDYIDTLQMATDRIPKPFQLPDAQTTILIISDLGLLQESKSIQRHWLGFGEKCQKQGNRVIALTPLASCLIPSSFYACYEIYQWFENIRQVNAQQYSSNESCRAKLKQQVEKLLILLSPALYIERPLFRNIAKHFGFDSASTLEAMLWNHPNVTYKNIKECEINKQARQQYQQQFSLYDKAIQKQVLLTIKQYHQLHFPSVWASELLQVSCLYNGEISEIGDIEAAEHLMNRIARSYYEQDQHSGLSSFAERELYRQNTQSRYKYDYNSVLFALEQQANPENTVKILTGCKPSIIRQIIKNKATRPSRQHYQLYQIGQMLQLLPKSSSNSELQRPKVLAEFTLNSPLLFLTRDEQTISIPAQEIQNQAFNRSLLPWFSLRDNDKEHGTKTEITATPNKIQLDTGRQQFTLKALKKQESHYSIGVDTQGVFQSFEHQNKQYSAYWKEPDNQRNTGYWDNLINKNNDEYGIYADLHFGEIKQRFRWIDAGTFLMGSPKDEVGRWGDEETQHQVTLTQGFWLADTAVTQVLWQKVMGENPSYFNEKKIKASSANHPVEQVSWDDCQQFIKKLQQHFPERDLRLPTEAEWEYACRAGTNTPFSFGENLTSDLVNYDGNFPYGKSEKDEYRAKTVEVKHFPSNDLGLYEMHGNVWEWCQDKWVENLGHKPVTDPITEAAGTHRVLRGGGWYDYGRFVRSAFRFHGLPDHRDDNVGLRLALGQSSHSLHKQASAISVFEQTGTRVKQETVSSNTDIADSPDSKNVLERLFNRFKGKK